MARVPYFDYILAVELANFNKIPRGILFRCALRAHRNFFPKIHAKISGKKGFQQVLKKWAQTLQKCKSLRLLRESRFCKIAN